MRCTKINLTFLASGIVFLACSARADTPAPALTAAEIFQKSRDAYAALTSYTDQGKTVSSLNGFTITTTFTIKLARPGLYRIDWVQASNSLFSSNSTKQESVWSAGDGDFLDMLGQGPKKQASQEMALSSATGISGGAALTVPGEFFKIKYGNQLSHVDGGEKQLPDEKVGDTDCYVFSDTLKGRTSILWIGKQDFLIHQARTLTSAAAMKAALADATKSHPIVSAFMSAFEPHDCTSTETHNNIALNPTLVASDFDH